MKDLVPLLTVLGTSIGLVATTIGVMKWLVKNSEKRQDTTIKENTQAITRNNEAYMQLAESINNSTSASRSLEQSIRLSDEREHEFQKQVIESFVQQGTLLKTIIDKTDENHQAIVNSQTVKEQHVEHQTVVEAAK